MSRDSFIPEVDSPELANQDALDAFLALDTGRRETYEVFPWHYDAILRKDGEAWEEGRRLGLFPERRGMGDMTYTRLTLDQRALALGAAFHAHHDRQQMLPPSPKAG